MKVTFKVGGFVKAASLLVLGLSLVSPKSKADTVTVQDLSTNPRRTVSIVVDGFYSGGAYAGVVNLLVEGEATTGFCIDPFHFASRNALEFEYVPLTDAPKALAGVFPGEMGWEKADQISKLWGMAYTPNSASWGHSAAAALQIAIWETVAGDKFRVVGNDYGAADLLERVKTYDGPKAKLIGLTGPGQDYVVQRVPEAGATLALLGLGVAALAGFRRFRS